MKRILLTAGIAALLSAPAGAQTVRTWVSTSGSDANPCTKTQPCRNFAAAIAAVNPGGEVVVSDSGGYGAVTITKSVSIISPSGLHAAIAPTSGAAVTVAADETDVVVLRGLYLNSQGATTGISFTAGRSLHLENVVISGFSNGLVFDAAADLFVEDSLVRNNTNVGISLQASSATAFGSLDRVRLEGNSIGLNALANSRVRCATAWPPGTALVCKPRPPAPKLPPSSTSRVEWPPTMRTTGSWRTPSAR